MKIFTIRSNNTDLVLATNYVATSETIAEIEFTRDNPYFDLDEIHAVEEEWTDSL